MIAAVLIGLLKANLAADAGVLLVLAIRRLVRTRLGAGAAYGLWLAPLVAAAAVLAPHPQIATPMNPIVLSAEGAADAFVARTPQAARNAGPDIMGLLFAAWLAGTLGTAALVLRRQARFTAAMGRLTPAGAPRLFRAESPDVGPAVVGVFRPRIVAPADFEDRFGPEEQGLILAHERAHLANGDAGVNALACALQCLSWFNPLAHVAVRALRIDQELACDAAVIGRLPKARRAYAELLLKTQIVAQLLPLGCHWPAGAEHPLKERIAMLKSPLPATAARRLGAPLVLCACASAASLAWASQPGAAAPSAVPAAAPGDIPNNGHLEPEQARKLWRPGLSILCKPDENRELHNCRISGSPFDAVATAADVQREWPAAAKRAGLTGAVTLQCRPDRATLRLDQCVGYHFSGAAERPELKAAFEQAAVRVISIIRLKAHPGPDDDALPQRGFYTIPFNDHPALPGSPPADTPTPRFPDFLPARSGKAAAPAEVSQAAPVARANPTCAVGADRKPTTCKVSNTTPAFFEINAAPGEDPAAAVARFETSPNWARRPTVADLVAAYPAEAAEAHEQGEVLLHCHVTLTGKLADCGVLRETPEGAGFGAAALKLTEFFEATEQAPDGGPKRGSDIRIPIRFRLPAGAAPSAN